MKATVWRWTRLTVGAAILALLVARLGSAPVTEGLAATSPAALAFAVVVTAATTWCCALRWSLVTHNLGAPMSATAAYAAYYRSQFLNAALPGGIVGDVHRGARHGFRGVVWERALGQLVQVGLTLGLLMLLPSPFRSAAAAGTVVAAAVLVVVLVVGRGHLRAVLARDLWSRLTVLSAVAVAGHLTVFVVAARTAGLTLPVTELLPLGALVLLASAVPTNVAGWGPREGVAAWTFAVAGLGADLGLTVAVVYGVMSLVATLPGVVVLVAGRRRRAGPGPNVAHVGKRLQGALHG